MIHRKSTFFLGIFVFLIPFMGLPTFWKTLLITLSGLALVFISIKIPVSKKQTRSKPKRDRGLGGDETVTVYPKDNLVEPDNQDNSTKVVE